MIGEAVRARARATLGTHEQPPGSNWGPEIEGWLAEVDIHGPASWCSAWLYSMFEQGCIDVGLPNPYPRTALALNVWALADPVYRALTPVAGAVAVFRHIGEDGKPDGHGHVELVDEIIDAATYRFIGGNTSGEGERQGNAVATGIRQWTKRRWGRLELVGFLVFETPF